MIQQEHLQRRIKVSRGWKSDQHLKTVNILRKKQTLILKESHYYNLMTTEGEEKQ